VKRNDLSLLLAARLAERDDWPLEYFYGTEPNGHSVSSTLAEFRDRTKGVFLKSEYKNLRLTGSLTEYKTNYVVPHVDVGSSFSKIRYKKLFLDGSYTQDIREGWSLTASLTYNRSWFDAFASRDSHELLGEITSYHDISDRVRLTIGGLVGRIEGTEIAVDSTFGPGLVATDGTRDNWAAYAQVDYQFVDTARLIGGFQVLKYEDIDPSVVPRLGLVWNPSQRLNVKVLYAEAFRAPYLNENFIDIPGIIAGNPMLEPEIVESYELGISYLRDTMEISVNYFNNTQSDIISYAFSPDSPTLEYFNVPGDLQIEGFELEYKYYVNESLFLSGSLLSQSMADNELTGISDFGAKAGVSYRGELGTISLFDIYQGSVSERLYNPNSSNPEPGSYNLLYLHADLDLMKLLKRDGDSKLKLFLQGDNLLGDEELWLPSIGGVLPASLPYKKGREVYVGFEVGF
jgi:outer membrane receptor protein involved in Fe transport